MSENPLWLPPCFLVGHTLLVLISKRLAHREKLRIVMINLLLTVGFLMLIQVFRQEGPRSVPGFNPLVLWSPLIFFWWAYLWTRHILGSLHAMDFVIDPWLIRQESVIGQPSLAWMRKGNRLVNELAHLFYGTYYLFSFGTGLVLHVNGRLRDFQEMTTAVCLGYLVAYTLFAIVPAHGPRWSLVEAGLMDTSERKVQGYLITRITLRLMYGGPAFRGGAMPSSHASTAAVFAWWGLQLGGWPTGLAASIVAAGMCLGAVYGRYHFVLDILAGLLIGFAAIPVATWLVSA